MISQLSWKIGGQQGEGIESTDRIFSAALNRLGYYLYGYRHFSSRIKGGHTNNKIRISTKPIRAIADRLDILVALDQETIELNASELHGNGVIVADKKFHPVVPDGVAARLLAVPMTEIAENLGASFMKNMVASGASWALLGLPLQVFIQAVREEFSRKGPSVADKNVEAVKRGAQFIADSYGPLEQFRLEAGDGKGKLLMIGNEAIGLGAVAAGCRLMPAYPITPASEIMEYLTKTLPRFGGTVIQTEDEIASINMAIGSGYGGARAMTATAGPGLSLMMEGIGLAGMTETPVVIVDTQRGGPSTGMPTKQEQSDLNAAIYGTHGEIPKIVIAPSTIEECFYDTVEAFNLADVYQCPIIILTDLQLSLGKQSCEVLDYNKIRILRGNLATVVTQPSEENAQFPRYAFTSDGISPRVLPGTKYGMHHVTGVEHDETGRPSESPLNRKNMMNKRMGKMKNVKIPHPIKADTPYAEPDLLIIGMGSTIGTIDEARSRLEKEGIRTNRVTVRQLQPFPAKELEPHIYNAKTVVVMEQNATGQLASLLKLNIGHGKTIRSVLKYDGNPFLPAECYNQCKELVPWHR